MSDLFQRLAQLEHYEERSPLLAEGVRCATCSFRQHQRCAMLNESVEYNGACRFWMPAPEVVHRQLLPLAAHDCARAWAEAGLNVSLTLSGTPLQQHPGQQLLSQMRAMLPAILQDLAYDANAYILKEYGDDARVHRLALLHPSDIDEIVLEDGEFIYVGDRAYSGKEILHIALPVREHHKGISPIAQAQSRGVDINEADVATIYRMFRVPLNGVLTTDAARGWCKLIEDAFAQDEDLFPVESGVAPIFSEATGPVDAAQSRSDQLLAAILEVARREPATVNVAAPTLPAAPDVHVTINPELTLPKRTMRVERDADGNAIKYAEE